jgi:uncharacterized delta-60 repeat protein
MSQKVKIGGVWKDAIPYAKVGSTWKLPKSVYNKINGVWKSSFLQGGINDESFTSFDTVSNMSDSVFNLKIQPDGKIIAVGNFVSFNNLTVNRIVRFNSDGTVDTSFNTYVGNLPGANSFIFGLAIQSDGKILIGGDFTSWNGTSANRIVRLNSDGTRDTSFNVGTGTDGRVSSILIQSDGKILISGIFTTYNGSTSQRIARLNSDGTRDTTFTTNQGTGVNSNVNSFALQSDGKILLVGDFSSTNGVTVNRILRLNSDGTRDTSFTSNTGTGFNASVTSVVVQSDGKILVGGAFSTFNSTTVNRIVRLNSDGTRDTTFTTNIGTGPNQYVNSISIQSDAKILVTGDFTTFNSTTVNRIVRLNSDGTRDSDFTTNTNAGSDNLIQSVMLYPDGKILLGGSFINFNGIGANRIVSLNSDGTQNYSIFKSITGIGGQVSTVAVQSDGKILVGGLFTSFNGASANRIVRLNSDGTRDTTFNIGTGPDVGTITAIAIQPDNKILLGGNFQSFNGVTANSIIRLNINGDIDTTFFTATATAGSGAINSIAIQSDGKILLAGSFLTYNLTTVNRIVRLNSDGTRDAAFTTNTGTGAPNTVNALAIQSDGKILLGGSFLTFNGATVNRIVRLNSDGTRDTAFTTNAGTGAENTVNSIAIQLDGKIVLGGSFTVFSDVFVGRIVRLNSDGTRDAAFTTNTAVSSSDRINSVAINIDGKILLGGTFTSFNNVVVNRIVRLNSDGTRDAAFTANASLGFDENSTINSIVTQLDGKVILSGIFTKFNNVSRNGIVRIGGDFAG